MEEESMTKTSVAKLAGRFTCQTSFPTGPERPLQNKPARMRPPGTLQLTASSNEKKVEATSPGKIKSAAFIKLQENLVRSPTALMPPPMSPGAMKAIPAPFSPCSPGTPPVVLSPSQEEVPASFETPAEGNILQSINKGRARHSIKRRPPSRRNRKTSGDEGEAEEGGAEEEKAAAPAPEGMPSGASVDDVVETQKTKAEETDGASTGSATSLHHSEPNQSSVLNSDEQQLPAGEDCKAHEETSAAAGEEKGERETKHEEPPSSQSMEPEPQSEVERAVEVKVERKEEPGGQEETKVDEL